MTFGYVINHHTINILCLDSNQSPEKSNKQPKFDKEEKPVFHMTFAQLAQSHENILTRESCFDYPRELRFRKNRNNLNLCNILTWKTFFLLDFSLAHSICAPHKSTLSGLFPVFCKQKCNKKKSTQHWWCMSEKISYWFNNYILMA